MSSTPTTRLRLQKQGTSDNSGTWGGVLNANVFDLLDTAIAGRTNYTLSSTKTLTSSNYVTDEARAIFQDVTGGTGGTVTIPSVEKVYAFRNATSGNVVVSAGGATTATLTSGTVGFVVSDGSNCYLVQQLDYGASLLSSSGTPTTANHLANKSYVDTAITNAVLGSLSLGTGVQTWLSTPTSANLKAAVTDETGSGALVFGTSPTIGTPTINTPTISGGTLNNCVIGGTTALAGSFTTVSSSTSILSTGTGGVGYATGAGGSVTQAGSVTTAVTLNKICGSVTTLAQAQSTTPTTFTFNNSTIGSNDTISVTPVGVLLANVYVIIPIIRIGAATITYWAASGTTNEALTFNFTIIKGATS